MSVIHQLDYLKQNYRLHTDKYFLRSKKILQEEDINPIVRYQVFARRDIEKLVGVTQVVDFIKLVTGDKVKISSLEDGDRYVANQPIMKLEGRVQDLIDLETVYLGILSGSLTDQLGKPPLRNIQNEAKWIVHFAEGKKVYYFGARHFHPYHDAVISRICQESGFAGCSTDLGSKWWNSQGIGTVPHALILAYWAWMREVGMRGNPTLEATRAFDKHIDLSIPRIALIDTFNKEQVDSLIVANQLARLSGIRIDTCGENFGCSAYDRQATRDLLDKFRYSDPYIDCKGVSIHSVWKTRRALDLDGHGDVSITVSSGFNSAKVKAFMEADRLYKEKYGKPLFDSIGTGSFGNPITTTSDVVAFYNEALGTWVPHSKVGRKEILSNRLERK